MAVYILTIYHQSSRISYLCFPVCERVCKFVSWRNDEVSFSVCKPDKTIFAYNPEKSFTGIVRAVIILRVIQLIPS